MQAPREGEDGGRRPGDDGNDWLWRRRRGPSELASARRLELCLGQPQRRMIFRVVGSGYGGGVVVETKGGRCFNVSRQGGGRKVTWASIRAEAPMIMAVQFSAVKLSFATGTQGYLGTISYLQLEIAL